MAYIDDSDFFDSYELVEKIEVLARPINTDGFYTSFIIEKDFNDVSNLIGCEFTIENHFFELPILYEHSELDYDKYPEQWIAMLEVSEDIFTKKINCIELMNA